MHDTGASIGLIADDVAIYCSRHNQYFVKTRLEQVLNEVQVPSALEFHRVDHDTLISKIYSSL